MTYAILLHPSFLRLYRDAALRIAVNELTIQYPQAQNTKQVAIGGVPYLCFDEIGVHSHTGDALRTLSRFTFTHAIFTVEGDIPSPSTQDIQCILRPLEKNAAYFIDDALSAMLKYTGKTNERFTRLLLHLAEITARTPTAHSTPPSPLLSPPPLRILDPLAGKGTTLYEALQHGHHAYGIEADAAYPAEADRYLKKFLETARYKFTTHQERISGQHLPGASTPNKPQKFTATRHQITTAPDKDTFKSAPRQFEIIQGDTRHAAHFYKKYFFDAIVADLPYGVQHGAKPGAKPNAKNPGSSLTRNAAQLLHEALPEWRKVLRSGGTLVLSWNRFLIPRAQMEALLATHGFTPPEALAALDFAHRVDQAIDRDVIVAQL
ncbi:MAG: hypothetical protein FWC71_07355 [Defluviitaleaceae bacterium]|nr:hypothetical protein [Defluviitaleaceae bacterium]